MSLQACQECAFLRGELRYGMSVGVRERESEEVGGEEGNGVFGGGSVGVWLQGMLPVVKLALVPLGYYR